KRSTNVVVAELDVWVVGSEISAADATPDFPIGKIGSGPSGAFWVALGFLFTHTINPATIITGPDHPDFGVSSSPPAAAPPAGGTNYKGDELWKGVNAKWDGSRIIRQKTLNPKRVSLPDDPSLHGNFPKYPTLFDGDGHPGGAGAISFEDWLVVGNDDAW